MSLLEGGAIGLVAVIAVFLSNIPEGLSSAAGMKAEGKCPAGVFALWSGIALISGISAGLGYVLFAGVQPEVVAFVQAVAAGAIRRCSSTRWCRKPLRERTTSPG